MLHVRRDGFGRGAPGLAQLPGASMRRRASVCVCVCSMRRVARGALGACSRVVSGRPGVREPRSVEAPPGALRAWQALAI